jgi:O-antigen/teichoic acid export membrane protein
LTSERSSYRQIFKATSLFGGVQVFNILIGIVRVKFVAVLLGTTGVGMIKLFNAPIELIMSITGLGIAMSAVRDISEANERKDSNRFSKVILILRRWSLFAGFLGAIVTMVLSPLLSKWSFGDQEYTWAFIWLSVILLFQAISKGQAAILQGARRLKYLAKAGVLGSSIGLFTSVPLYYFFGIGGIVPSLIITAFTVLILNWYFARKVEVRREKLSLKQTFSSGIGIAKLGIYMTMAGFIASLSNYILNAYISLQNGVEYVGLYNAGWGVVAQYTNIIFAAMATDYFPRLSSVQADNVKIRTMVRQQTETALIIITPFLALLIITMPLVVRILYTEEFLPIVMFANLTVLGMQFKAVSWAMGYVYLAKGDGKLFLFMEILAGGVILALNLILYSLHGLNGLGISFILSFLLGSLVSYMVLRKRYDFSFPVSFFRLLLISYIFALSSFLTVFIGNDIIKYLSGALIFILASIFTLKKLNDFMDIKAIIKDRLLHRNK